MHYILEIWGGGTKAPQAPYTRRPWLVFVLLCVVQFTASRLNAP